MLIRLSIQKRSSLLLVPHHSMGGIETCSPTVRCYSPGKYSLLSCKCRTQHVILVQQPCWYTFWNWQIGFFLIHLGSKFSPPALCLPWRTLARSLRATRRRSLWLKSHMTLWEWRWPGACPAEGGTFPFMSQTWTLTAWLERRAPSAKVSDHRLEPFC